MSDSETKSQATEAAIESVNGVVETRFFRHTGPEGKGVQFADGKVLPEVTLAYEMYGEPNADKSNVILLFHALSGAHHAAGINESLSAEHDPVLERRWTSELHLGWWDQFIGPGRALDTEKYCIVCANYLGHCYGSTGPASTNPETGKPYGSAFPELTIADVVRSQAALLDHLGVDVLHAVVGPSVGGLMAQNFAWIYPERVKIVMPIATGWKTTVYNRLILFEQILAIENDPHFNSGDYYDGTRPEYGLALARMISHKTFVHLDAIERRARRTIVQPEGQLAWYEVRDPFQSYMLYQGKKFVERFDANTYLRIIDMWARFDPVRDSGFETVSELFAGAREHNHRYLVFSIDSDFCFYPEEQQEIVRHLEANDVRCMHITVHSDKGHDSFLLEPELFTPHIAAVLNGQV
ncbi:homoserine O-acetyltransferase MetX [Sulfuriroseicoccus oceanibius]|uniref:Homoserine O-acetyltransferase n=1 Tax=Sulfuriroseicoccus oceanibius TaxID=2707525 RepID=A0A6B3L8X8_9BACT|nr:homoserine O-acetyltransferase [Sulfuriroseicoccus oceanibius]QQL45490.1 homoserine O-acetyltransferase [Sulfuriroseicoccus oceanibius]